MRRRLWGLGKHLGLALFYGSLGVVVTALVAGVWWLNSKPDLALWHQVKLKSEFDAERPLKDFPAYLALEQTLFEELEQRVYNQTAERPLAPFNRYYHGSFADPAHWATPWNRSFEWPNPQAEYGLLLVHGMSDSPYYLAHIGQHFADRARVLGLRLPGHGTLPSALTQVRWQDMAASLALAARHMRAELGDRPLVLVGFSTGAALALQHELSRLSEGETPLFDRMVFISPAIGLSPVARGAWWQARIGQWLGLDKLAWESVGLEYHPFKYGSFAVNAGDVVYRLTQANQALIEGLSPQALATLPPMLTFNSIIDQTVDTQALFETLYLALGKSEDELVLFDINRTWLDSQLLTQDPISDYRLFLDASRSRFRTTLVENRGVGDDRVQAREIQDGAVEPLPLSWPQGVHSLSHVALTIPRADPLLGPQRDPNRVHIHLGGGVIRGERGMLAIPADEVLRQKWNPFYPYLIARIERWIEGAEAD
ncbi:alpha/beta hydrolase [Ferrimonas balearica]|uniref:alpha/beta hydrolase n=1 Tax=Ferrimonas balearica TaxID=44012 RepID=UPI001C9951FA|nr:alpha/beta fold hydrolase [Ferrimonas balearica]MBY5992545.1 alpha/beta fold hydrolase [Ferrimonas balearica]